MHLLEHRVLDVICFFPFFLQVSQKYGLIYVITKLGLLFVYDLETAAAVYRNRISPDPIFLRFMNKRTYTHDSQHFLASYASCIF